MAVEIMLPPQLATHVGEERFPNQSVAVFVNGTLLCPDHPDDDGDYSIGATRIRLKGLRPDDLLVVTNFRSFRWTYQDDKWFKF